MNSRSILSTQPTRRIAARVAACLAALCFATAAVAQSTGDVDLRFEWPNWRGPQQNRISTERKLIDSWNPRGGPDSNLLWKRSDLGGISTPVVFAGRLYTIVRDQAGTSVEGEKVVCLDATTGDTLWQHRWNVYLTDVPDTRVGWSSCVVDPATGNVYALGVCGYFCCLDGATGQRLWSRSLHEEFGLLSTYGGRTNIPVVFEDLVLASAVIIGWGDTPQWGNLAKPAHRFLAFDKSNGELRWLGGTRISPYDTTYSTPTVATLGQQAALVFGSGDGAFWALQPRTGRPIWQFKFSRRGLNVSPLVAGDAVYMSHSEENIVGNTMGSIVAIDGTGEGDLSNSPRWQHFQIMAGKSSPILVDGRVYAIDDRAKLFIYDAASGELVSRKALGSEMRSTPLFADGKLYLCTNGGRWYILAPTPQGVRVVHKLRLARGEGCLGSPIVSRGRIYLPTTLNLYCIGNPQQTPMADPIPDAAPERSLDADRQAAHLEIAPYDVLLAPGDQQQFGLRLFNAAGQFLREVGFDEVSAEVDGSGSLAGGVYTAASELTHAPARITASFNGLTAGARVRVVPPLPWNFTFDDAQDVPLTWVGGRVRYVLRDVDGERLMVKRNVLPTPANPKNKLGTRSRMWMGSTELNNYTIQADVQLQEADKKLPDVGLINSRYTLSLTGTNQEIRLGSWSTHDFREQAVVPFKVEPHVWYRLKLRVDAQPEVAHIHGKVWHRDSPEPSAWTLSILDRAPNQKGSPGLYGNARDAEIYLDNISVTANAH